MENESGNKTSVARAMSAAINRDSNGAMTMSINDCRSLIGYFVDGLISELLKNGRVELRGFCVFSLKKIKARQVRNPRNGTVFVTPETYRLTMKPSAALRKAIKNTVKPQ